jgi:hypothetical protein
MLSLALGARRKARGGSAGSRFRSLEDTDAGRERPGLRLLPLLTPSRPENETAGNERERIGPKRNEPAVQKAKAQVDGGFDSRQLHKESAGQRRCLEMTSHGRCSISPSTERRARPSRTNTGS